MWEKSFRRDRVFPRKDALATYFNINFRQDDLSERPLSPQLIKAKNIQKSARILKEELQKSWIGLKYWKFPCKVTLNLNHSLYQTMSLMEFLHCAVLRLLCSFQWTTTMYFYSICEKRGSGSEDIYLFLSCDLKSRFSWLIPFHTWMKLSCDVIFQICCGHQISEPHDQNNKNSNPLNLSRNMRETIL